MVDSKKAASESGSKNASERTFKRTTRSNPQKYNPFIRAENEDDDGYDPYSDRRVEPPLFEEDPWR